MDAGVGVGVGVGVLVESGSVREALAGAGVGAVGGESDTEVPREQRVASLQDILRYLHTLSVPSAHLPSLSSSSYIQFLDPHALHAAVERQHPLVGLSECQDQLYQCVLAPYDIHPRSIPSGDSPAPGPASSHSSLYALHRIRPCSGILIQGDTGCGKTSLAHWVVAQARDVFR